MIATRYMNALGASLDLDTVLKEIVERAQAPSPFPTARVEPSSGTWTCLPLSRIRRSTECFVCRSVRCGTIQYCANAAETSNVT